MKKILNLILTVIVISVLSGCQSESEQTELSILVPEGSAHLVQLYMEYTHPNIGDTVFYEIDQAIEVSDIRNALMSESYDIIYAPIIDGAKAYLDDADYRVAAIVATGNLYLVTSSTGEFDMDSLEGREIIAYDHNSNTGAALEILLAAQEYDVPPLITYVESVNEAIEQYLQDSDTVILIEEPFKHYIVHDVDFYQEIDLQQEWEEVTGDAEYPYMGIFVKGGTNSDVVSAYLREVQISINKLFDETTGVVPMAELLGYPVNSEALNDAVTYSGITYYDIKVSKPIIAAYFDYIIEFDISIMGDEDLDNGFYYN